MTTNIFVNLPIEDLEKSKAFFEKLGYTFNKQFTDDQAACLVIEKNIFSMLVTKPFFKTLTKMEISDNAKSIESLIALSVESKERVDEILEKAIAAGAKETVDTNEDLDFMYSRAFRDLDGHVWNYFWMDPKKLSNG